MNASEKLTFEEKIKLLNLNDKIYLDGYVDRALKDIRITRRLKQKQIQEPTNNETSADRELATV